MKFREYNNYDVFEDGRIWSYKYKKFLKPKTLPSGYQQVKLYDNEGNAKMYLVHRVVWESVTRATIPEGMQINHISEVKNENFFENLELVSPKQNLNFGTRNERARKTLTNGKLSKKVGAFKDGKLVLSFPSIREAQRQGFDKSSVSSCCNGKLKTHKGFEWKYL